VGRYNQLPAENCVDGLLGLPSAFILPRALPLML
jgi:hypothetical protein